MSITTINPATGKAIQTYELLSTHKIETAINDAHDRFQTWSKSSFDERRTLMLKMASILRKNANRYAAVITEEMGKPIASAVSEVEKCAWVCEYYADNAEAMLNDELIETDATKSYVSFRPLGVVLAVMPWNYPFWQVFRFIAPALMAGNVGLLKHASNVPASGQLIEDIISEAGFPASVFRFLLISSDQVENILKNDKVVAATLTGSEPAGASVSSTAASELKKSVLELGGNDPYLVLHDADIDLAAEQCVTSRLLNNGQSCIAAKRFIVVESIYEEFLIKITELMNSKKIGDPTDPETDIGPMAREDLRDEVHQQVINSIKAGATLHLGGTIPDKKGAYYPPTILTHVKKGMPAYSEEIFGPVATVIKVKDESEAIAVANDSSFGLGACVFSKDVERAEKIAKESLQAGCCFVNHYVKSDPRLPFGGIKRSGFGRELSHYGIKEFVNIKTVYVS